MPIYPGSQAVIKQETIAGAALPAAGVLMHAQDLGGAPLNLTADFTVPLPARSLVITRGAGGPASVDYTVTWTIQDGTEAVETIAVPVSGSAESAGCGQGIVNVRTTVDPVSTSDFATGTGFALGVSFDETPTLSVNGIQEVVAGEDGYSGTIFPTTAPNGARAFTVLLV
jgi:hypothetical protein